MLNYKNILHWFVILLLALAIVNSFVKNNANLFNTTAESDAKSLSKEFDTDANLPVSNAVTFGDVTITIPEGESYADRNLVLAVIKVESGNNPTALSKKNAYGLMQLKSITAKHMKVNRLNPQENVNGGSKFLQIQINRFKDVKLGLAAYNYGPNALRRAMKKAKAKTWEDLLKADEAQKINLPEETKNYVSLVTKELNK
jgi:soluble lytic murein transglycosylase-like protein